MQLNFRKENMKAFIRKDILERSESIPTLEGPHLNTKELMDYMQTGNMADQEFNALVHLNSVIYTVKSIDLDFPIEFKRGDRVRAVKDLDCHSDYYIKKWVTGIVTAVPNKQNELYSIKLDQEFEQLEAWGNQILVGHEHIIDTTFFEIIKEETASKEQRLIQLEGWEKMELLAELESFSLDELDIIFNRLAVNLTILGKPVAGSVSVYFNKTLHSLIKIQDQRGKMSSMIKDLKKA